jgi:hypothetical protein
VRDAQVQADGGALVQHQIGLAGLGLHQREVPKWGIHEENAPNRLVAPDGSRFEFAAPYFDPLYTGPGSLYRYLAIEGRLNGTTWVDQKLSLVKADDFDEALQLLYRTALRLKANPHRQHEPQSLGQPRPNHHSLTGAGAGLGAFSLRLKAWTTQHLPTATSTTDSGRAHHALDKQGWPPHAPPLSSKKELK